MLTPHKKALILTNAGLDVPAYPQQHMPNPSKPIHCNQQTNFQQREADTVHAHAVTQWNHKICILFAAYAATRAAKSLRDAEEVRQLDMLRRANL